MRRFVGCLAVAGVLAVAGPVSAHDPLILTEDQKTPADGPLLLDGTISFALYGDIAGAGDTRGFRVRFAEGDRLYLSILIPDLAPENELTDEQLPYLIVEDPTGETTELRVTERRQFSERFTQTNYVELTEVTDTARKGTYSVTITGSTAARFTVSVGTKEQFGTAVENVPNRDEGVPGVLRWYEGTGTSTTASSTTSTVPSTQTTSDAPSTGTDLSISPTLWRWVVTATLIAVGARLWAGWRRRRT